MPLYLVRFVCIEKPFAAHSSPMYLLRSLVILTITVSSFACAATGSGSYAVNSPAPNRSGAVNINTASVSGLENLPYVGPSMAMKIVEHREKNGAFRRAEHLMLIDGISETRFRQIRPLIRVE